MTRVQKSYLADMETIYFSHERNPYSLVQTLYIEYKLKFPGEYFYD